MPAVLDVPEVMDYETHEIPAAHPQVRPARAGFWRTLVQYMSGHNVRRFHRSLSSPRAVYTCEAPVDLLARQYPTLCIQAYAGI